MFATTNSGSSVSASHNPRLVISEVYVNVVVGGSSVEEHEWFEIHNPEQYPVNLDGWTVEDAQAIARLPDIEVAPGGTVVVVGASADIVVPAGGTLVVLESPRLGTGLRNAGDRVALVNPFGVRHDAVSWGDVRWPRYGEVPNPRQSIIRTLSNGQTVTDRPTPWTVSESISARPERYRHPRPDTMIRFVKAVIDPLGDEPESVTLLNASDEPLLTVNWSLTIGNAVVRFPSVRIEPGSTYTFTEADGKIGSGLAAKGGHLVLRDLKGNWLSTASWGDDRTFHDLPRPEPGAELHFNPRARIHPRTPWSESFDAGDRILVGNTAEHSQGAGANISSRVLREQPAAPARQDSEPSAVWISEVYPNAGQGRSDAAFEWFELTNSTDAPIVLDGWSIADNTSSDALVDVTIPPQASIVISASAEANPDTESLHLIADGRIGNGLANAGDQLRLITPQGEIASAVSWGNDRSFSSLRAPKPDESVQRSSPDAVPVLASPSPGTVAAQRDATVPTEREDQPAPMESLTPDPQVNDLESPEDAAPPQGTSTESAEDVAVPTLRITEILPAPLPGQAEWVEIQNLGDQPVDLAGWSVGDSERKTELSGTVAPHSRFVISTQELEPGIAGFVVARIGNGLNNNADTISLFAPDGTRVDQVQYGNDAIPAPDRGLSIALEPERWVVTAHPTPGSLDVTPLLGDALRSASVRPPISDEDRLPLVPSADNGGTNAWVIVSFALIGVILTLVVRRWRPDEQPSEPMPDPAVYSGPATEQSLTDDLERSDEEVNE